MHFPLLSSLLLAAAAAGVTAQQESPATAQLHQVIRREVAARDGVLDSLYMKDKHFRRTVNSHLVARGNSISKPKVNKDMKQREKDEKKWKKASDKLRNEYIKKAMKEGRKTLSAQELAEIQRILASNP